MKWKKRISLLLLCVVVALSFENSSYGKKEIMVQSDSVIGKGEPSGLYAKAAVLLDAKSKRVLFEKNGNEILPMASTTKIMTCILALENGNLDDYVTISQYAARMPRVKLNVREGEAYILRDLLYSLMLESHNDAAVAIAEHIGGSVEQFAKMMNQKARDIGCHDTFFITPNGLDATTTITQKSGKTQVKEHSTTAADLAKIMAYCITTSPKKEEFLTITRTQEYQFCNQKGNRNFSCRNHNAFLTMMEGALSGKTGFTGKAGYCYVGALERDGRQFVVALLACGWPNHKTYKWSDTTKIMNYALDSYQFYEFESMPLNLRKIKPIPVEGGQTNKLGEIAFASLEVIEGKNTEYSNVSRGILMNAEETMQITYTVEKKLTAPVEKGEVVGSIQYCLDDEVWKVKTVVTSDAIEKIDFAWCFQKIMEKVWL